MPQAWINYDSSAGTILPKLLDLMMINDDNNDIITTLHLLDSFQYDSFNLLAWLVAVTIHIFTTGPTNCTVLNLSYMSGILQYSITMHDTEIMKWTHVENYVRTGKA